MLGEYLHKDPEKRKKYARENAKKHGPSRRAYHRLRTYGITQEQYDAMAQKQNQVCAICHRPPKRVLVVDHDHITGDIRGLLCDRCNVGLGWLKDWDWTTKANRYLYTWDLHYSD